MSRMRCAGLSQPLLSTAYRPRFRHACALQASPEEGSICASVTRSLCPPTWQVAKGLPPSTRTASLRRRSIDRRL
eukprot:7259607-Prorocentrum_lima.AAC.1